MVVTSVLNIIRQSRRSRSISRHWNYLASQCTMGAELNAAPWQKNGAVLNLTVGNKSGDPTRIVIGDYCNLNLEIHCEARGRITIGNHVFMSAKARIRCDHEVHIGDRCMFGPEVRIWDTNNHPMSVSARRRQAVQMCESSIDSYEGGGAPVRIGADVWLCMEVIVLAGVTIGSGSVIGAGSVVTSDIPPMSFAAGVPAKFIRAIPD
jgi:acetyltransferase-like isoleucine patch superfamily enzyme